MYVNCHAMADVKVPKARRTEQNRRDLYNVAVVMMNGEMKAKLSVWIMNTHMMKQPTAPTFLFPSTLNWVIESIGKRSPVKMELPFDNI